jgi:hypothetical protein
MELHLAIVRFREIGYQGVDSTQLWAMGKAHCPVCIKKKIFFI